MVALHIRPESVAANNVAVALGYSDIDAALRDMRANGIGTRKMAKLLHFTRGAICYRLRKMGLTCQEP